jgi:hypothetical protein
MRAVLLMLVVVLCLSSAALACSPGCPGNCGCGSPTCGMQQMQRPQMYAQPQYQQQAYYAPARAYQQPRAYYAQPRVYAQPQMYAQHAQPKLVCGANGCHLQTQGQARHWVCGANGCHLQ